MGRPLGVDLSILVDFVKQVGRNLEEKWNKHRSKKASKKDEKLKTIISQKIDEIDHNSRNTQNEIRQSIQNFQYKQEKEILSKDFKEKINKIRNKQLLTTKSKLMNLRNNNQNENFSKDEHNTIQNEEDVLHCENNNFE